MLAPGMMEAAAKAGNQQMAGNYLPVPPRSVEESGLPFLFLVELLTKILFRQGQFHLADLCQHIKLPVSIVEHVLDFMRTEKLCEMARGMGAGSQPEFALSETGRERAADFMRKSQYAGVAPVSLKAYSEQVQRQTISDMRITREGMQRAFANVVVDTGILDQLGAAMNSRRAIYLYGQAGTGKTFIAEKLVRLLSGTIAIPDAVLVDNEVMQVFDPLVHHVLGEITPLSGRLDRKVLVDPRWRICRRPVVITGGELTLSMLDLDFDDSVRFYQAPPHIKA
ncbi:MAG: ATP-binding protein, partial [Burkholderiales bacterium]